jgi:hypothetical protein
MMTRTKMLCARAGASAIAAALALSPTYAAAPKPIVDLSKSPALTKKAEPAPPAKQAPAQAKPGIGPFDQQQTLELGGGAIALLALGAGAFAISRSRRKRREEAQWNEDASEAEAHDPLFDEPIFQHAPATMEEQPAATEASAFARGGALRHDPVGDDCRSGETWVERAKCGPTPDNPSLSLRARLKRAAFFEKREREAAAGKAEPVDADAGLPEAMVEEQAAAETERELA